MEGVAGNINALAEVDVNTSIMLVIFIVLFVVYFV